MKLVPLLSTAILIQIANAIPVIQNNNEHTDPKLLMSDEYLIYTSEFEIVNIIFPMNGLQNINENDNNNQTLLIFFVEEAIENEKRIDKGLYVRKNGEITKLLDNGRDAAAINRQDLKEVYFGASDGLYTYNYRENKADRYGTLTDNIKNVAKLNNNDALYILTTDNLVFRVTNEGTEKERVTDVDKADHIIVDNEDNLFFRCNKEVFVLNSNKKIKVTGLPNSLESIKLLRPPFFQTNGILIIVDKTIFIANSNGTSYPTNYNFQSHPTALTVEGALVLYFGHNKKIYEYNVFRIILSSLMSKLKDEVRNYFTLRN